jgi:hypothetical protein
MDDAAVAALLLQQEQALLTAEVRGSRAALEALLAPEFVEFGSSGRVFDRAAIVAALRNEIKDVGGAEIRDFRCTRLGPCAALATYTVERAPAAASLRSSVWLLRQQRWVMVFHQGTRIAA